MGKSCSLSRALGTHSRGCRQGEPSPHSPADLLPKPPSGKTASSPTHPCALQLPLPGTKIVFIQGSILLQSPLLIIVKIRLYHAHSALTLTRSQKIPIWPVTQICVPWLSALLGYMKWKKKLVNPGKKMFLFSGFCNSRLLCSADTNFYGKFHLSLKSDLPAWRVS